MNIIEIFFRCTGCLFLPICCIAILRLIQRCDKELPENFPNKISIIYFVLLGIVSFQCLLCRVENLIYVIPLMILCCISAYTDFYTKILYSVVSVAALVLGVILLGVYQTTALWEMILVILISAFLILVKCMKMGDLYLLTATYPYLVCIAQTNPEESILLFLIVIFLGLVFSILLNFGNLLENRKLKVAYAPYHLLSVFAFVVFFA